MFCCLGREIGTDLYFITSSRPLVSKTAAACMSALIGVKERRGVWKAGGKDISFTCLEGEDGEGNWMELEIYKFTAKCRGFILVLNPTGQSGVSHFGVIRD